MRPQGGLGRGLGSLIPSSRPEVHEVAVNDLVRNPHQPRQVLDPTALAELVESVRRYGVLQPIVVSAANDSGAARRYQIIAGERRWQAAKIVGLSRVPVVVKEATPQEMLELALVENIQRADLNPLEEAAAYRHLVEEFRLTQEQVAERVGRGRVSIANALRLLQLPDVVKEALAAGRISEGHARAILGFPGEDAQRAALQQVLAGDLSVRETEELARRFGKVRPHRGGRTATPETRALESQFRAALGTKVSLFRSSKGGKLVIHFYSDEELQALYDRFLP